MNKAVIAAALSILSTASQALDLSNGQVHGFASQAYLLSDGNNFYGDSQRGSSELTEIGLNANWRYSNTLNFAGQVLSRNAGATDNGSVRIDYLFADYKAIENDVTGLGVRIGRVRNAYGFYNETRDVLFTRPSILMPQAIYYEGNGLRELLFSSDGAQLYSYWDLDNSTTSFSLTAGRNKSLSKDIIQNLLGTSGSQIVVRGNLSHPIFAQLSHSVSGGRSRFALSMYNVGLDFDTNFMGINGLNLYASGYVLSAQHNLRDWSFTTEYSLTTVKYEAGILGNNTSDIEATYLQAEYRLSPAVSFVGRLEYSVFDRDNRNASDTNHLVIGTKWSPTRNWTIAADLMGMRGTGGIPDIDNPGGTNERTELLAIMVGYRF